MASVKMSLLAWEAMASMKTNLKRSDAVYLKSIKYTETVKQVLSKVSGILF